MFLSCIPDCCRPRLVMLAESSQTRRGGHLHLFLVNENVDGTRTEYAIQG